MRMQRVIFVYLAAIYLADLVEAQVTYERLLNAGKDPGNWMTYSGSYRSWRYSSLDQISRKTASRLKVEWVTAPEKLYPNGCAVCKAEQGEPAQGDFVRRAVR